MEADLVKANDRKRSLHGNRGFSTNSDSFSIANIEMQGSFVELNELQASFVGTFETGKDAAQIFSETRSAIRKKTKFRERMEQLDSSDCSDQSQINKHPEEVGLSNTDQTNTVSGPTLSDEGISEENIDSFYANERSDVPLAIVLPPVSQSRKKLLVLDLNGLLADIVYNPPIEYTPDALVAGRASKNLVSKTLYAC